MIRIRNKIGCPSRNREHDVGWMFIICLLLVIVAISPSTARAKVHSSSAQYQAVAAQHDIAPDIGSVGTSPTLIVPVVTDIAMEAARSVETTEKMVNPANIHPSRNYDIKGADGEINKSIGYTKKIGIEQDVSPSITGSITATSSSP